MVLKVWVVVCAFLAGAASEAAPQTTPRPRQPRASRQASGVGSGWTALEAGRVSAAVSAADAVLQQRPHDHAAIVLKIQALASAADINAALDAYTTWTSTHREPDLHLLGIAAEAVLEQIATNGPEMAQRVVALETLAGAGDKGAAETLAGLGPSAGVEGELAKARLGDAAAAEAVAKRLAANPRNADLIRELGKVKAPPVENALIQLLANSDPGTRASAADALAGSGSDTAAAPLVKALGDPEASVRQSAAVALAALGRPEGGELVDGMLQSGVPDIVLSVAEAMPSEPGRWEAVVQSLLDTENPVDRLRAARLLGSKSPDATRVLSAALSDENVAVREEAARALSELGTVEPSTDWRRLLSDPSPWVRLEAARALWRQVTQ